MDQEKQIAQALIEKNLSWPEWLDGVAAAKQIRELGIPSKQLLESIEAATELRGPVFRAAALDLLELRKRTGKNSKELKAYIGELSSQSLTLEKDNAAKEKLKLNLGQDIKQYQQKRRDEKARWEQDVKEHQRRHRDEKVKLESEKAKNRRVLEEDTRRLEQQFRQNNQTKESIAQATTLRNRLAGIGLDLPCFISIVEEASQNREIDLTLGKEISKHITEYGSFLKAKERMERELKSTKANAAELSQIESEKRRTLTLLEGQIAKKSGEVNKLVKEIEEGEGIIKLQVDKIDRKRWQYQFFEAFISMLLNSPSAAKKEELIHGFTGSALEALALKIVELAQKGWVHSTKTSAEERRGIFIATMMGVYLHSIHCEHCETSFIVNKSYDFYDHYRNSYYCPVCTLSLYTKPDDGFLEGMISPALVERLQVITKLLNLDEPHFFKLRKLAKILPEDALKDFPEDKEVAWHLSEDGVLILRSKP